MLTKERKRDFFESAFIQYFLEQGGNTQTFVDEFHINFRNSKLFDWNPRRSSLSFQLIMIHGQ